MKSIETDLYRGAFQGWDLKPLKEVRGYGPEGVLHTFENELGSGEYWAYFRGSLFAVNAFRMNFAKSGIMRYRCTEHICLGCYDDVKGMVQRQGAPLAPGAIMV
jgi:transcriptional regulator, araC family